MGGHFFIKKTRKTYSKEFKNKICREYLEESLNLREIVEKYNISSITLVSLWLKKFKMTNGIENIRQNKKYSFKFKTNVIEYYLNNRERESFQSVADKFGVVNQGIVASWYYKFLSEGILSLSSKVNDNIMSKDRNNKNILITEEQYKSLEHENMLLKIELEFLKKKEQLIQKKKLQPKKKS